MVSDKLKRIFSSNRTEELGYDVWKEYVVSPAYPRLHFGNTQKPRVIVGGRGCGKTMLLRYLSHESAFSKDRGGYPEETLSHIGLYWRADTQFASLLDKRGLKSDTWRAAFGHLAAIVLGAEILRSLKSIYSVANALLSENLVSEVDLRRLQAFSPTLPSRPLELLEYLEDQLAGFEMWANDIRNIKQPEFLPPRSFLKRLTGLIREQIPTLRNAIFYVYIDEYENLSIYQQRMVNTWLKHSEPPLIFNLAMKRNGFKTRRTEGDEALSDIHDFRDIDLEDFGSDEEFQYFAAEILLSRLSLAGTNISSLRPEILREPNQLSERSSAGYRKKIITEAQSFFPSYTYGELAERVFSDSAMVNRLKNRIAKALKQRRESSKAPKDFLVPEDPMASIIMPALLFRERLTLESIEKNIRLLRQNEPNQFYGSTDWVHNNFVGCYLQLFDGLPRPCPFYSGFLTLCYMSKGNLRHFLELCHQALNRAGSAYEISQESQAAAARQVSAHFLSEIRSFGSQGDNLHAFVLRLGSLFSLSQQQPTQSEPEKTHFAIQEGESELTEEESDFISEAIKWSVLFRSKGTKKKTATDPEGLEYVLNPIYAPYFHISYRKKRKLELPANEVSTLIRGNYDQITSLLKRYQAQWTVDLDQTYLPLFSHLDEN